MQCAYISILLSFVSYIGCTTLIHIILQTAQFTEEDIDYKISVSLSPQFMSETFLILIRIQRDFITN